MRRAPSLIAVLPLAAVGVLAGLFFAPRESPDEGPDPRVNEVLVEKAYQALRAAEARHQRRFSEALDPETAEAALQARLELAVESALEDEIAAIGFELFVRDRAIERRRKPAVEANRCASCHNRLGAGGAGGLVDNYFGGRNPPALGGAVLLERLALEMSEELQADAKAGRSLQVQGISFGSPGAPKGVSKDLRVRPFGRGRWANLDETIAAMGKDALGIELSQNERLALAGWIGTLPAPGLEPPDASRMPDLYEQYLRGRKRFRDLGCAACHVPELRLQDGTRVAAYTDLKFHDLGPELGTQEEPLVLTAPLWGLAATPPWLHDGRALASLDAAILLHGGEASAPAKSYEKLTIEERGELKTFLLSLAPAPKLQIAGQ